MATQLPIDCLQASIAGAKMLACPTRLVRGKESELIAMALPFVESRGVILDMSAVRAMDAAGVGSLMTLRQVAERAGTSMVLVNPSRRTRETLQLLGLDSVLLCKTA
jgi:anti-anti-sigma factor